TGETETVATEAEVDDAPTSPATMALSVPAEPVPPVEEPAPEVVPPPPPPPPGIESSGYVPQVFGVGNRGSRVTLRALADSWVQVQGPDSELLLTRVLRSGDVYLVPDRTDLTLVTGNAGGLEVLVDGRSRGTLGA